MTPSSFRCSKRIYRLLIFFLLVATISYSQALVPALAVGDQAPTLAAGFWRRKRPVSHFENQKIYLVDFGSVSCGPCRASIPDLSRISKSYDDKVVVVSVYVYENGFTPNNSGDTTYLKRVDRFLDRMGSEIAYGVVVDDANQTLASAWLKAANMNAIPTVFVVDARGQVAWIGNPVHVEPIIRKLVVNMDANLGREQKKSDELLELYQDIYEMPPRSAIKELDSLISMNPNLEFLIPIKFAKLLQVDERKAYQFAWSWLKEHKDEEVILSKMSNEMLNSHSTLATVDWDLYFTLNELARNACKDDIVRAYLEFSRADAYRVMGNIEMAKAVLKSAIDSLEKANLGDVAEDAKSSLQGLLNSI